MTVLENLLVAQHNPLMKASGYTILGVLGLAGLQGPPRTKRSRRPSSGWRRPT